MADSREKAIARLYTLRRKAFARIRALRPEQTPPEPRAVSLTAKFATLFSSTSYGLGALCFFALLAFLFCGLGGTGASVKEALGKWEPYGRATLIAVEETDHSLKNLSQNKIRLLKLSFSGQKDDGSTFSGVSYTRSPAERGDEVEIERLVGTDDVLHVKGASISGRGPLRDNWFAFIFFTFLFVVEVVQGIVSPMQAGLRALKFLTDGEVAVGTYRDCRLPPKDKKGRFVAGVPATVVFGFDSKNDGGVIATFKTTKLELLFFPTAPLLYLPDEPLGENALFYFDLPRGIYFDSKKGVCGRLPTVLLSFVLIALALTGFVATLATTMNFERATVAPGPPASVVSTDASESPTIEQ